MQLASRGDSLGFAERCKKNLLHIEVAKQSGQDVHVVTQIIISCLGLVVFPWEQQADLKIREMVLNDFYNSGRPMWDETPPSEKLGNLIHNLRNAIAHGDINFSSDDREASKVIVTFKSKKRDWQAKIPADNLKNFCLKFIEVIENTIG